MTDNKSETKPETKKLIYGIVIAAIVVIALVVAFLVLGAPGVKDTPSASASAAVASTPVPTAAPPVTVAAAVTTTPATSQLSGSITLSGAFALYPLAVVWASEYEKTHPNVKVQVSAGGAGKGITDAIGGLSDIGMSSRALTDAEVGKGAYAIPVTTDAVVPVINAKNPVANVILAQGINQSTWKKIYINRSVVNWGQVAGEPWITDKISLLTRSDSSGAADVWAQYAGGKAQADLRGIGVYGDPGILSEVLKDPLAVGYNNINYAYDANTSLPVSGVLVPPFQLSNGTVLDISTKDKTLAAIKAKTFPYPPARVDSFVTKGKPSGVTADFIHWTLTDGQKFVDANGYVQLPDANLTASLAEL